MDNSLSQYKKWYEENYKEIMEDYFSYLSFPSISSDSKHKEDVKNCANWLKEYIDKKVGMVAEVIPTTTHPLVFAENKIKIENAPTLLIYGHYDVVPIDPISEWETDPFTPVIKGKEVFARGSLDDKGQTLYALLALKYYMEKFENCPINIKVCLEGEEESSSIGLIKALDKLKDKLKADYLLVPDSDIPNKNTPAITLGMRGAITLTVEMIGSDFDLHSGQHGGIVHNPLRSMVKLLSLLWDDNGRVTVPNFYSDVKELSDEEKKEFEIPFDKSEYKKMFGVSKFYQEDGFSVTESNVFRPVLEINGIGGGYAKEGFKTIIPAKVVAKLSCRTVPSQDPNKIGAIIKDFLVNNVEKDMKINVVVGEGGKAMRCDSKSKLAKTLAMAYTEVFGQPCKKILIGASVPIVAELVEKLGCDAILMGMGLPDDHMHGPNEHFGIDRLEKGFLIVAKTIDMLSKK
jgi:acetylornithine deacetylase/succinyl-diaminopimelate desuccinylase-like protein